MVNLTEQNNRKSDRLIPKEKEQKKGKTATRLQHKKHVLRFTSESEVQIELARRVICEQMLIGMGL